LPPVAAAESDKSTSHYFGLSNLEHRELPVLQFLWEWVFYNYIAPTALGFTSKLAVVLLTSEAWSLAIFSSSASAKYMLPFGEGLPSGLRTSGCLQLKTFRFQSRYVSMNDFRWPGSLYLAQRPACPL